MKYTFIIISYNEEEMITRAIRSIKRIDQHAEIIVSDGGSDDKTVEFAKSEGVIICACERGRGIQLNKGAALSTGEVLVFMHADTELPATAIQLMKIFEDPKNKIGTFLLGFNYSHPILKIYSWFSRFDSVFTTFGDSCIIVHKSFFDELGGFKDWQLFEDVDFFRRARSKTKINLLGDEVKTSARRFLDDGLIKHQLKSGFCLLQFLIGKNPNLLAQKYYSLQ